MTTVCYAWMEKVTEIGDLYKELGGEMRGNGFIKPWAMMARITVYALSISQQYVQITTVLCQFCFRNIDSVLRKSGTETTNHPCRCPEISDYLPPETSRLQTTVPWS